MSRKPARINRHRREPRTRPIRVTPYHIIEDTVTRFLRKRVGKLLYTVKVASRGFIGSFNAADKDLAASILQKVYQECFSSDKFGRLVPK